MAERLTLRLFKGPTEEVFKESIARLVRSLGGDVLWDTAPQFRKDDCRTSHQGDVHGFYFPYQDDAADFLLCAKIGERLNVPWIEARVQEGSHWDFSLYSGAEHLDSFSTLPEYWLDMDALTSEDQAMLASQRGRPDLLAKIWDVPQSRIEKYMKGWGWHVPNRDEPIYETLLRGKAYDDDKFEYGNIWQMYDFILALGASDPMEVDGTACQHSLRCPSRDRLKPRTAASPTAKHTGPVGKFLGIVLHKFTRE